MVALLENSLSLVAKRALDWALSTMIPHPPLAMGRVIKSHLAFALALTAFPP